MDSDARSDKLRRLQQSIQSGDFQAAERLLRAAADQADKKPKKSKGTLRPQVPEEPFEDEPGAPPEDSDAFPAQAHGPCAEAHGPTVRPAKPDAPNPISLSSIPGGRELTVSTPAGPRRCWEVRTPLADALAEGGEISRRLADTLRGAGQRFDELQASPGLCHAANAAPEDLLFLDIATAAPPDKAVFLIGTLAFRDGRLACDQHLAREDAEEPAILQAFADRWAQAALLVSFDADKRDLPALHSRLAARGLAAPWTQPPHLALLGECRQRWRKGIRGCTLASLERRLLARRRHRDIPPNDIPDVYEHYLRTNDARGLADILRHNLLNLASAAEFLTLLLTGVDPMAE